MNLGCHYWGQGRFVLNLGDALVPLILEHLGYGCQAPARLQTVGNPGRTLLIIGSLLDDADLDRLDGPIDVWGCGWRGRPLASRNRDRLRVHAVRGPLTVRGLELPPDMPVGDPGFLMPRIIAPARHRNGQRLVLPHCLRIGRTRMDERLRATGADRVLSPWVLRRQGRLRPRPLLQDARRLLAAGTRPMGPVQAVQAIAGAGFVLTGSLHGAILSHAYGTPWAAYDDLGIDTPAKWQDLATLLEIDIGLVRSIREGEAWWDRTGQWAAIPDMDAMLRAFPHPRAEMTG